MGEPIKLLKGKGKELQSMSVYGTHQAAQHIHDEDWRLAPNQPNVVIPPKPQEQESES